MKKVLIDLYKMKEPNSGLGQFSRNFHLALKKLNLPWQFTFLVPQEFNDYQDGFEYLKVSLPRRIFPSLNRGFDLWHSLQQFPSHHPPKETPQLLTVHDLNFLREKNKTKADKYLRRLQRNTSRAEYLSAVSDFTRKEMQEHLNLEEKEVSLIYNGVNFGSAEIQQPEYITKKPFFFSIGVFNPKKNFEKLIPLMAHFPDHQLVIAGKKDTSYGALMEKKIAASPQTEQVILPGEISEAEKLWLYRHCEAFLFPSLAEGFGLPVIEAMHEGRPVFCSRAGSLPEIGGKMAYYWNELDPDQMAKFLRNTLEDFRKKDKFASEQLMKYAGGFSWDACISKYLDIYKRILR